MPGAGYQRQRSGVADEYTAASHTLAGEADAVFAFVGQFNVDDAHHAVPVQTINRTDATAQTPALAMVSKVAQAFTGNDVIVKSKEEF